MASIRYAVLGFLASRPMHGYELNRRFTDATGGFWKLNFGQIYSTLDRLERDGLIERLAEPEVIGEGGISPDRKVYRITVRGRSDLQEWIQKDTVEPRALRDDLFIRLLFCKRSDLKPLVRLIESHRRIYETHMRKLVRRKAQLDRLDLGGDEVITELLMEAALFHADAELRWLSHIEQTLSRGWSSKSQKRPHK